MRDRPLAPPLFLCLCQKPPTQSEWTGPQARGRGSFQGWGVPGPSLLLVGRGSWQQMKFLLMSVLSRNMMEPQGAEMAEDQLRS